MNTTNYIVLAVILLIAVITDISKQKIYNWLTFPGILAGIIICSLPHNLGWKASLLGLAVSCIWGILFLIRATGAGDLKLMMVVGAFTGPAFMAWTLLYTAVAGGVLGIIWAFKRGVLSHTIQNTQIGAEILKETKSAEAMKGVQEQSKAGKMPYAPAIAIGVLIEWLLMHFKMNLL